MHALCSSAHGDKSHLPWNRYCNALSSNISVFHVQSYPKNLSVKCLKILYFVTSVRGKYEDQLVKVLFVMKAIVGPIAHCHMASCLLKRALSADLMVYPGMTLIHRKASHVDQVLCNVPQLHKY